ncbi:hypothetical protein RhiirC2_717128 [Rhizophagus irregularis]|uniref:RNase H type-1 domain-containing protein n=1 Tax=Rhizophagus irregularis TaxID=588596 RepID=A0A2N1MNM3_9GLOM|nr:hypothetical protein RhiirC2_717128 [Rhizophagus irregularis]
MITWNTYLSNLTSKKGHLIFPHKWFSDIQQCVTFPDSNSLLLDQYFSDAAPSNVDLSPAFGSSLNSMKWIIILDENGTPLFGKQLSKQQYAYKIVHWTSDCENRPNDTITLSICPGCSKHVPVAHTKRHRQMLLLYLPLINLGTPNVSMGWSWVQVLDGAGFFQSIAAHAHGIIHNWPSSIRAEIAAIHAVLMVTPPSSSVTIHTNSQSAIDGLRLCATLFYSNSRLYYKTTNFELWAIIEHLISFKSLSITAVKVKGHSGNFYNDYADSLASSAHTSFSAILLSDLDQVSPHNFILKYDDILCKSNPWHLFKQYSQMVLMHRLTRLSRFNFTTALSSIPDFEIDWDLTWFSLNFEPSHDVSFTCEHASNYHSFKFKLFLEELPTLERLKMTRLDLYIDILSCRSCLNLKKDFMHLFMCKCRRISMERILLSYQKHFVDKL